jgi:hypothetical protein
MYRVYLQDYRQEVVDKLSSARDQVDLYRLQGRLEVLNELQELVGIAKNYVSGLASGTMKKIPSSAIPDELKNIRH